MNSRGHLDTRLHVVTKGDGQPAIAAAAAAARGGAGIVQVRGKDDSARSLLGLVIAIAEAVQASNPDCLVIVNDRTDVAWAARDLGAPVHGVHLGQSDLPVAQARRLLGPDAVVGLTANTVEQIGWVEEHPGLVDYLGAGPLRLTPTKDMTGHRELGVDGYRPLVAATTVPVLAIGDVTVDDVEALAGAGLAGVAMVRAVMDAADPESVAREVVRRWEQVRGPLA